MTLFTQKALRELINTGAAVDVSRADNKDRDTLLDKEGYLRRIGYARGVNGCNGLLLRGEKTGNLYAIASRSTALFVFL